MAALRREAAGHRIQLEADLAEVHRRLQRIISAIEKGAYNATVQARLNELEARQAELVAQLDALETAAPVVQLHPNAAAVYRDKVADLESALNSPEIRTEAGDALRALIERVVLIPDEVAPDGLRVELYGDLPEILCLGEDQQARRGRHGDDVGFKAKRPGADVLRSQLSVVAGACNRLCRTRFPALSRRQRGSKSYTGYHAISIS
jgi:site-specific DNA recombinase